MIVNKAFSTRAYYAVCCFVLYFAAAAASFTGYYDKWHFSEAQMAGEDTRFSFEKVVEGTATRPVAYRVLLPTVANWVDAAVPKSFERWLYNYQNYRQVDALFASPTAENPVYFFRYLILYLETFICALLAIYAMRLVCVALGFTPITALFTPVIVILLVPFIECNGGYYYDYPELAFVSLAVWTALKFDWWWIIPVALLGTWNKESFLLFMPALYPFLRQKASRLAALAQVSVLMVFCGIAYLPVRMRFAGNPGDVSVVPGLDQLNSLLHPHDLFFAAETTYGLFLPRASTVLPMALLVWTVWRAWRKLPLMIQRHAQIAAAINLPLYVLFCAPGELRNLSMLYVVLLTVLATNLEEWEGAKSVGHEL